MSHYYQQAVAKIREGALVMQGLDNQRNLAAFLAHVNNASKRVNKKLKPLKSVVLQTL